jgi:glutaredoxin
MEFKAYTTEGCFYCTQLKKLFERANIQCEFIQVGVDIEKELLLKEYPDQKGYPFVLVNGIPIGGLTETAKYFLDNNLVSKK